MKKRLFSGVQPSGELHIGNYLGAIKSFVELQNKYDSIFCVVDYHTITVPQDPKTLKKRITNIANVYLAAGLDPKKNIIFTQSDVPEHTELGWILNNFTYFGEAQRMTQFKDKSAGKQNITVGLFDYPVLMAADILLYDSQIVPVGDDQKQHVELARDVAARFNNRFGKTFVVPEISIRKEGARIKSLIDPTKKMSKSDPNPDSCIFLSDTPDVIRKKIMRATTDSRSEVKFDEKSKPGISNLINIYSLMSSMNVAAVEKKYKDKRYGDFKKDLAEVVVKGLAPIQKKLIELEKNPTLTKKILGDGAKKARLIASVKLKEVKKKIGVGS